MTTPKLPVKGEAMIRIAILIFPLLFILMMIAIKVVSFGWYWRLMCREDGPTEWLTWFAYMLTTGCALFAAIQFFRQKKTFPANLFALYAVGFFVIGMEEISWGQRVFGIETPQVLVEHNMQGETNLHNILSWDILHLLYIMIGAYGAFAWKLCPGFIRTKYPRFCAHVIPPRLLMGYFLPVFLLYLHFDYLGPLLASGLGWDWIVHTDSQHGWFIPRDQEPIEMLLSLGFLFFISGLVFERVGRITDPSSELARIA